MTSVFGLNSSGDNNYFNSLSGLNSSKKSSTADSSIFSGMLSGASALGDYSMIQSGAYKKLLNAYYGREKSGTASETDKKEMINLNTANADASSLNASINKLMGTAVTEENRDTIKENIKSLVENYNSVIDSVWRNVSMKSLTSGMGIGYNHIRSVSSAIQSMGGTVKTDKKRRL